MARRKNEKESEAVENGKSEGERSGGPFGLGSPTNNLIIGTEREKDLKDGFISIDDITEQFIEMRKKTDGRYGRVMADKVTGETKTFPVMSRWNGSFNYGGKVRRRFEAECSGLREVKMIVLTVDRKRLANMVPEWWSGSDAEYIAVYGSVYVSKFLKLLRRYRALRGRRWNFIAWVMEFHDDGVAHYHLMFRGGYVAPFEVMEKMWGLGSVRYKAPERKHDGKAMIFYLTRYITKDLKELMKKGQARIAALIWYFKKRFYNVRHAFFDEYGLRVSPVLQETKWEPHIREGNYKELMRYAKQYGIKSMQQLEQYIYGVKLRRAFHDENTSEYELLQMRVMLDERLRQNGYVSV